MNPAVLSALISVVTATVVTLGIEFAAKPRLEARKDRVVSAHREFRALVSTLVELGHQLYEERLDTQVGERPRAETAAQIVSLAQTAHRQAVNAESTVPRKLRRTALNAVVDLRHHCELVAELRGVDVKGAESARAFETLTSYLESADRARNKAEHLYTLPRWKFWRRNAAISATYDAWKLPPLRNFND
ncbi:hypothetical protein [Amycolatopsis sp. lyj-108]|uniref:hypothetical protein n=1 Tax=Amycolatopsis sp. lyj-108 TaxID=2789286 RepID=UPI00397D33E1